MSDKSHDRFQLERLAFFSDAVFAIAITLLVIDVRLPHVEIHDETALANALLALIPQYAGFVISFFVIGRFWISHHTAFGHLRACDDKLVWRNLLFLLTIAAMPFPTAIVSEFAGYRIGVAIYAGWLIFAGLRHQSVLRYAFGNPALVAPHSDVAAQSAQLKRSWAPIIIGVLGLAIGMIQPIFALVPLVGSPLIIWGINGWVGRKRPVVSRSSDPA